ncbi:hypothetical protein Bp8pS_028 [Bacillus phage vB_BpuM-BpSp]|nr:hypothetical protein Bp8pS_028 [Bacillus phage vB_BpuM-BpSp]
MKTIRDSAIFKQAISNPKVVKNINAVNIDRDAVKSNELDEALNIISRRINFGGKGKTLQHFNNGKIIPIWNPTIEIPKYLSTFGMQYKGQMVSVINLNDFAKKPKGTEVFDIYPKLLFNLMQNGMIQLELANNWNRFTNNINIIRNSAIVYAKMNGKILDKLFATSIEPFRADLVSFLLAKFFLINMCGKIDSETVDNIAYYACFNKSPLKLIKEEESKLDDNAYDDIFKFFENIKDLKGMRDLTVRVFINDWVRMYGESSLLAVDNLASFYSVIFGSVVNGGISKDYIIESVAGKYIADVYTEFSKLLR